MESACSVRRCTSSHCPFCRGDGQPPWIGRRPVFRIRACRSRIVREPDHRRIRHLESGSSAVVADAALGWMDSAPAIDRTPDTRGEDQPTHGRDPPHRPDDRPPPPARGCLRPLADPLDPRRGADLPRRLRRRRAAVRDPDDPRTGRRSALHPRLAGEPDAQGAWPAGSRSASRSRWSTAWSWPGRRSTTR